MCRSTVDIQSARAVIRRGKKKERKKNKETQHENIMASLSGHNKQMVIYWNILESLLPARPPGKQDKQQIRFFRRSSASPRTLMRISRRSAGRLVSYGYLVSNSPYPIPPSCLRRLIPCVLGTSFASGYMCDGRIFPHHSSRPHG